MKTPKLRLMIYTALMTAFIFIATSLIKIPVPLTNGYIHAGDTFIFVSGILLGPWYAAFAAGIGSALADLYGGYTQWIIPTLIVKAIMGAIVGGFSSQMDTKKHLYGGIMMTFSIIAIGFVLVIRSSEIGAISMLIEHPIEATQTIVQKLNKQLLALAVLIPTFTYGLFLVKEKYNIATFHLIGMIAGGIWMVLGYYVATGILYGSFILPIFGIPGDIAQFSIGIILAFLVTQGLAKAGITHHSLRNFK